MKKSLFFIVALFVCGLTAIQAQPDVFSEEALKSLVGLWEGSYSAGQGETGLTLSVYEVGGSFKAIFYFYNLPGQSNAADGKYYMNVSYNTSDGKFFLRGYEWILRPNNYTFADLEGTLTENVFSGYLSGSSYDFRVTRIDEAEIARRETETQQKIVDEAVIFRSNLVSALGTSLANEVESRFTKISTPIVGNTGTDARNIVAWRNSWIERLTETENLFNKIFSNRKLPYVLFYSTSIQQGRINYQTETIELNISLNLRMKNEWISILDKALQTIKTMDDGLQSTGRRKDWGLEDWPNTGMTQTNPFRNLYSGGGFDGVKRHGTEWKTDFSIVVEILNANNRVIGKQTIEISPFFEIYCNNRNFYGNFIEYGRHGGTIVDAARAIRLRNEIDNIKTIAFTNVKISDISDIMTIRIASVNGKRPENAGIQIMPLSDSQWSEKDWKERQEPVFYFR